MIKTILIDDIRDLPADIILRKGFAAVEFFSFFPKHFGLELVMFDHDLGEGPNGNDVLKTMLDIGIYPDTVELVTANPVGLERMINTLFDSKKYEKTHPSGREWKLI